RLGCPAPNPRALAAALRAHDKRGTRNAECGTSGKLRAPRSALRAGASVGRDLHRRGERLVLVVRRRSLQRAGCAVRLPVPEAPAERLFAPGRPAAGGAVAAD